MKHLTTRRRLLAIGILTICTALLIAGSSLVSAQTSEAGKPSAAAKAPDPMDQYRMALATLDGVVANIVLINTPQGQRGLTRGDVDELRRCTILLNAALEELKATKTSQPAVTPETPVKAK